MPKTLLVRQPKTANKDPVTITVKTTTSKAVLGYLRLRYQCLSLRKWPQNCRKNTAYTQQEEWRNFCQTITTSSTHHAAPTNMSKISLTTTTSIVPFEPKPPSKDGFGRIKHPRWVDGMPVDRIYRLVPGTQPTKIRQARGACPGLSVLELRSYCGHLSYTGTGEPLGLIEWDRDVLHPVSILKPLMTSGWPLGKQASSIWRYRKV